MEFDAETTAAEEMESDSQQKLLETIDCRLAQNRAEPFVVAISGPSGSGKSTFARELMASYQDRAVLIDTDSYYIGKTAMQRTLPPESQLDFDNPLACNLALLARHLRATKSGRTIRRPNYDMLRSEPTEVKTLVIPKPLIIIEGIFASQPIIRREVDVTACLMVPFEKRLARRIQRDQTRKGFDPKTIERIMREYVEPAYRRHIAAADQAADLIIYR